jgi:hypothetical protein
LFRQRRRGVGEQRDESVAKLSGSTHLEGAHHRGDREYSEEAHPSAGVKAGIARMWIGGHLDLPRVGWAAAKYVGRSVRANRFGDPPMKTDPLSLATGEVKGRVCAKDHAFGGTVAWHAARASM